MTYARCCVCFKAIPRDRRRRFCEAHDQIDLALKNLDAQARGVFERNLKQGLSRAMCMDLAREDREIRLRLQMPEGLLTRRIRSRERRRATNRSKGEPR